MKQANLSLKGKKIMQGTIMDEEAHFAGTKIPEIQEAIAEKIGRQKYRIWFQNSAKLSLNEGYLKVGVPNLFIATWLENHFLHQISQAVRTVTGRALKVSFTIDNELAGNRERTQIDSNAGHPRQSGKKTSAQKNKNKSRLELTLDKFIVGSSNQLAYNAAKAVVDEEQSPFNPLFIHGGYGLGKTHLLQGICNCVSCARPQARWSYISAEDFVNQFVLALKTKKLEAFRRRIRKMDLLAIDDIHFLASKPSTQEEFLHTFNSINLAGKQVVLASDAHPKMIGKLSEKLINRFVSGMVVKIDKPNFKTRCEICRQYANSIGTKFSDSVIKYISEHLKSNVRELQGALLKLTAFSSLQNKRPTISLAREVLAEHLARTDPIVHISDIESSVAHYFGTTPSNIHSHKKDRTVSLARHFSMYLARKHTRMSSSEIGRFMGNKNHATVLLACRKVEELLARNAELNWQGQNGNKIEKARQILGSLEQFVAG